MKKNLLSYFRITFLWKINITKKWHNALSFTRFHTQPQTDAFRNISSLHQGNCQVSSQRKALLCSTVASLWLRGWWKSLSRSLVAGSIGPKFLSAARRVLSSGRLVSAASACADSGPAGRQNGHDGHQRQRGVDERGFSAAFKCLRTHTQKIKHLIDGHSEVGCIVLQPQNQNLFPLENSHPVQQEDDVHPEI